MTGVPRAALSRTGTVLLAIVGLTYAVDFAFPTDILAPGQPPETTVGMIHLADAFLGWLLFVVSAFMIDRRLKADSRFARMHGALVALTWGTLALLILLVGVVAVKAPVGGLVEKAFIVVRNIWAIVLALALLGAPTIAAPRLGVLR